MKRIAIVGSPGVGKTVFSRRLAEKTGLPLVHLDFYYHDKKHDYEHDREAWIKRVERLTTKPEWIIDGNYRSTFPLRFDRADTIIFMDYRRWRALKGVFARRLQYRNKLRTDMPEGWSEKIPRDFFMFVWNFNKKYRSNIVDSLDSDHNKKLIVFRCPADASCYFQELQPTP